MKQAVVFSPRVLNTIQSLPELERSAISSALASEFLLGITPSDDTLTPFQTILYTMIRSYVERDMNSVAC